MAMHKNYHYTYISIQTLIITSFIPIQAINLEVKPDTIHVALKSEAMNVALKSEAMNVTLNPKHIHVSVNLNLEPYTPTLINALKIMAKGAWHTSQLVASTALMCIFFQHAGINKQTGFAFICGIPVLYTIIKDSVYGFETLLIQHTIIPESFKEKIKNRIKAW